MGLAGSYSPDGTRLAINRKAQSYWRKFYRGAYQSDVTVMDLATKTFKDLTDFHGMDSWPMWSQDGFIYFVSDRDDNAQANIWRVPESGGEAERVTDFTDGDVRFPAISGDGKTIVFERDFGIAKLDIASKKVEPLTFDIAAETQESLTEFRDFHSTVDDYDLAPDGKRIAFAVHGEVFTAPTDEGGELRQITDGPARDQNLLYSPDGKWLAYVSDQSGREEIYVVAADGSGEPPSRSPTSTRSSPPTSGRPTRSRWPSPPPTTSSTRSPLEGKDLKELAASKYGRIGRPAWSPDGKWIAFSRPDVIAVERHLPDPGRRRRGEESHVRLGRRDEPPVLGRRQEALLRPHRGRVRRRRAPADAALLHAAGAARQGPRRTRKPAPTTKPKARAREGGGPPRGRAPRTAPPTEPKIDWAGLKRRTRQVTRGTVRVSTYSRPATAGPSSSSAPRGSAVVEPVAAAVADRRSTRSRTTASG